ncbi:6360_t:CDS:2 [Cetraspora pellucida]|uniref:6360_t:CDS:1 n=1 Tax=Cetraspora pellucida TaxID=1433469 RepID=A0A9N9E9Y0_9GLOM|nr:6360_t:CDS:2 [Cetraspora pellucida]
MAQRHTGGPEKHRFTKDIIVLGVKTTNKYNTSCICKACNDALGCDEALNETFTNKKNVVRNHLKKYKYFRAKLDSQEAINDYCNKTDNKAEKNLQASKKHPNADDISVLLRITISNGWAFHWTTNPKTKKFFKFLNPAINLPSRSKNILNQHIFGSLFILSTGEVQIWEAIDTSSERERMIKIIPKIENMIRDALSMKAKLLAIVSDSAPAYAAASLDELYFSQNITAILLNDNFWQLITQLHTLLLPYYGALNKLQSDTAHLYDVLQAFGGILRMWEEYSDQDLAQPFLLNPFIHAIWFNYNNENLNFTYLAQFVTYYYKAWFERWPICILLELEDYRKHRFPFDFETYEQFEKDILRFWEFISSSTKELGSLAIQLFRICVNAASVE